MNHRPIVSMPVPDKGVLALLALVFFATLVLTGCGNEESVMNEKQLADFATRYAAAWSGGDPAVWSAFYAEDATFRINEGETARGRAAVEAVAASYMEAFPDMNIAVERVVATEKGAEFHWRWTGTNTGPGGTGRPVDMTGYEEWTFSPDGLIRSMQGHFDDAEYQRQMSGGE